MRFVEIPNSLGQDDLKGKASSSYANFVNYQIRGEEEARLKGVPALALMTRSRQANATPDVVESDTTSEGFATFLRLRGDRQRHRRHRRIPCGAFGRTASEKRHASLKQTRQFRLCAKFVK